MPARVVQNPFTPTFGQVPFAMAGRDLVIREMSTAFDAPNRAPELTMLISGARGSGKTALLTRISEEAAQRGWICVNTVAAPGMLEDILVQTVDKAGRIVDVGASRNRLNEIGIGQVVNVGWERVDEVRANWRLQMQKAIEALNEAGTGLLIAVDEVDVSVDEAVNLASIYQLFVMEGRRVSLVMAGLPYNIEKAKGDKRISFVRRAQQRRLGRIGDVEVADAMRRTIEQGGRRIGEEALAVAVGAAGGFPYMIQLVGYRMWARNLAERDISVEDARMGAELALDELGSSVLESTYRDLSDGDIAFLKAMLPDDGPVPVKEVAVRMGKSRSYASTYRERLLRQGVIGEPDRNVVDFELPGFRDYLVSRLGGAGDRPPA